MWIAIKVEIWIAISRHHFASGLLNPSWVKKLIDLGWGIREVIKKFFEPPLD